MFSLANLMPQTLAAKLLAAVAAAALCAAAGAYGGYRWELGTYETRVAGDAEAQTIAVQRAALIQKTEDDTATAAAVSEAQAQQKIVTQTVTVKQEVTKYVPRSVSCISYGLVRVLDAAALGVDPGTLPLPTGKSNNACTALTNDDLASAVVNNYGLARQNAEQLNALIADVKAQQVVAQNAGPKG